MFCRNKPYSVEHSRLFALGKCIPIRGRAIGDPFPVCGQCIRSITNGGSVSHTVECYDIPILSTELLL